MPSFSHLCSRVTLRGLGFVLVHYGPTVALCDVAIYSNASVGRDGSHSGDPSGFFHLKGKPAALPRFWGGAGPRQAGRQACSAVTKEVWT